MTRQDLEIFRPFTVRVDGEMRVVEKPEALNSKGENAHEYFETKEWTSYNEAEERCHAVGWQEYWNLLSCPNKMIKMEVIEQIKRFDAYSFFAQHIPALHHFVAAVDGRVLEKPMKQSYGFVELDGDWHSSDENMHDNILYYQLEKEFQTALDKTLWEGVDQHEYRNENETSGWIGIGFPDFQIFEWTPFGWECLYETYSDLIEALKKEGEVLIIKK